MPRGHQHLRIEGSITKQSAIYHPKVAAAFARVISSALLASPPPPDPAKPGLESIAVNDILFGLHWSVSAVWAWKQQAHINVLEARAALKVFKHAVLNGGDRKLVLLLDSSVALGALAKGRTASRLLRPVLCQAAVQAAWDLAFNWLAVEPGSRHVAVPAVVLLALLSVNLLWGWRTEAGIYVLAFGALLRIGEATQATRGCLVLPRDVLFLHAHVLLRIGEPKTRLRAARHQAAELQACDLVELVDLAFAHLPSSSRLWPFSSQTLRRRLHSALDRLGIPTARNHSRPLDLGSFRPGGATHLLQLTEDAELVRRRGRWVSAKVMEIYLQEIAAATFFPNLHREVRQNVFTFAHAFPDILKQSALWTWASIPTSAWYHLWLSKDTTCTGVRLG